MTTKTTKTTKTAPKSDAAAIVDAGQPRRIPVPSSEYATVSEIRAAMIVIAVKARYLIPSPRQIKEAEDAGFAINPKPDGSYGLSGASRADFLVRLYRNAAKEDSRDLQVHFAGNKTMPIRFLAECVASRSNRTPMQGE
jgi:hypothetical protein